MSAILFVVTMAAFILFFVENYLNNQNVLARFIPETGAERIAYNVVFAIFMFGSVAYQAARLSFFCHIRRRVREAEDGLTSFNERGPSAAPPVEIIVPSYREEVHVIWQTLMSAALTDYPCRRVVLLLDNPPNPTDRMERDVLLASRAQIDLVDDLFSTMAQRFAVAVTTHRNGPQAGDCEAAIALAVTLHEEAAQWLEEIATRVRAGDFGCPDDHTRSFFVERILREPAEQHRRRAVELRNHAPDLSEIDPELTRLSYRFQVDVSLFERKRFANLSHAPTKAANLNAYISLMGRTLVIQSGRHGPELVDRRPDLTVDAGEHLDIPDAKYVIILDADSFLLRDYVTHMIAAMEAPGNERAAVMQTPYTAIPNTPHTLERTAGATTDIYYYVTEGMGFARAGFWVGASATIRKQALLDIAITQHERGYPVAVYIQDTTLIEDTGAAIDLIRKGWRVENYPARLSYSATPSDFGALVVQRRRWANGGLIILPNLLGHILRQAPTPKNVLEAALRIHYLVMPACISVSMLLMLVYPFDFRRVSGWIYVTLPPYLYLVCRDLRHSGYRRLEILRAYALFLVLLPVVLAGVKNSLIQLLFGVKTKFGRTPKTRIRTPIPLTCSAAIVGLFAWSVTIFHTDVVRGDGFHAVFALSNVLALGYGLVAMIGLRAIGQDFANAATSVASPLWRRLVPSRQRELPVPTAASVAQPIQLIPAIQVPSLQPDAAAPEQAPQVLRQTVAMLRRSTSLATLPRMAAPALQPDRSEPKPGTVRKRRRLPRRLT
ncbi:MAG: glycosyltransferase family 2 protein [Hyphomicrobiales bacterium]|nr:glycosyltransferase family 2 protein [Hyphomicrobiales bacterium]